MTFRPIHDHILVRPEKAPDKTEAEKIVPDIADQQSQAGKVVATGAGLPDDDGMTRPLDVKLGDRIVFGEGAGTEVKCRGEALIILKEGDVLGTLD
jgi:chaperonin GroES